MVAVEKAHIFTEVFETLSDCGFRISRFDKSVPWGAFFVLQECGSQLFVDTYFEGTSSKLNSCTRINPQILLVAPGQKLIWQYHNRRDEIFRVIRGQVCVMVSLPDNKNTCTVLLQGESIKIAQGYKHQIIGLEEWAVVAEMWQHTNYLIPSDDSDTIWLKDEIQ